jgi:CHAT domain-containing protein
MSAALGFHSCLSALPGEPHLKRTLALAVSAAYIQRPPQVLRAAMSRIGSPNLAGNVIASLVAVVTLGSAGQALGLSVDQARENCRQSIGRPTFEACQQSLGGKRSDNRDKCNALASPKVTACMKAALNAANARANVAIGLGDSKKEAVNLGNALPAGFVPPPRTIADIAAILDNEKPDPATLAKFKNDAEREPEKSLSGSDLAEFYYDRTQARALLGRYVDAMADARKGLGVKGIDLELKHRLQQIFGAQQRLTGDIKGSTATYQQILREATAENKRGWTLVMGQSIIQSLLLSGDIQQAEGYLRRIQAFVTEMRTSGHPAARETYATRGRVYEAGLEASKGYLFEARGNYGDAETAYKRATDYELAWIPDLKKIDYPPPEFQVRATADSYRLKTAMMKAKQNRLAEAEVDARAALLSRLKAHGKYHAITPQYVMDLAGILLEQGRYGDAETLVRSALDIQRTIGIADDTQLNAQILSQLGAVLTFQRKKKEASEVYAQLDSAIAKWEPARREVLALNASRINALLDSGQIKEGVAAAEELVKRQSARLGEKQFDTAAARGTLAVGYVKAGRDADAIREFRSAIPVLMASTLENADGGDATINVGRSGRLQAIVEKYIELQARVGGDAVDTFSLADSIRGQQVQNALAASSARSAVKDPALVELVRREQDLSKQINAQLGALNNALSSNAREDKVVLATGAAIDKLRSDRDKARAEINAKFPSYADLVSPKPPSVEKIKASLASGEAMLSFYFGRETSFVWAVPKEGQIAFAAIPASSGEIAAKVNKLRDALEPQAAMISDIPAFDIDLGYQLYSLLLKPVEAGWKQSNSLIVVTNGALGLLPLPLLPTAPSQIKTNDDPLFASYRDVPWLARTHAVTMVPSAAALLTLRQLPPAKPSRKDLIAFGDPLFSKDQEKEAKASLQLASLNTSAATSGPASTNVTRGLPLKRRSSPKLEGVDSAELAMLPRLPDTADELKSIALALKADPTEVLNLGKDANEGKVRSMDLSGFKILAFATHGLVPGELNGLTQPALALSSPEVEGSSGDGLLTMEDILALKLDADWVILSACNTGAGEGAGAEAASGLGRAFFYAGTRALLVTNWSVHSQSARELVTDLFKRQAADARLTRGEALRQAMMALADGPGFTNEQGKTEFAYAHPLFWAPYSIIGDGGRR